jgi:hypothetical protein
VRWVGSNTRREHSRPRERNDFYACAELHLPGVILRAIDLRLSLVAGKLASDELHSSSFITASTRSAAH